MADKPSVNHQCGRRDGKGACNTTANRWFVVTTDGHHLALCDMHAEEERARNTLFVEERHRTEQPKSIEGNLAEGDRVEASGAIAELFHHNGLPWATVRWDRGGGHDAMPIASLIRERRK